MLDLALWFMGNPHPVSVSGSVYYEFSHDLQQGTGTEVDVEDLATAFVKLENGATIVFDVSWISHIEEGNLVYTQLFGTKGGANLARRIDATSGRREEMTITTAAGSGPSRATLVQRPKYLSPAAADPEFTLYESFRGEVADFVDSIRTGRQPGATITHGLDILRVLDGIYRSAATGKEIDLHPPSAADTPLVAD
jgi:predicted dehydrogenase